MKKNEALDRIGLSDKISTEYKLRAFQLLTDELLDIVFLEKKQYQQLIDGGKQNNEKLMSIIDENIENINLTKKKLDQLGNLFITVRESVSKYADFFVQKNDPQDKKSQDINKNQKGLMKQQIQIPNLSQIKTISFSLSLSQIQKKSERSNQNQNSSQLKQQIHGMCQDVLKKSKQEKKKKQQSCKDKKASNFMRKVFGRPNISSQKSQRFAKQSEVKSEQKKQKKERFTSRDDLRNPNSGIKSLQQEGEKFLNKFNPDQKEMKTQLRKNTFIRKS